MNTNAFSDHGSWVRRPRADRLNNYISGVQLVLQKTRSNYLRNTDKIRSIHGISRKIANFYNTSAGARIPTALEGEALLGFHQFTERVPIRLTQTATICSGANDKLQGSWS